MLDKMLTCSNSEFCFARKTHLNVSLNINKNMEEKCIVGVVMVDIFAGLLNFFDRLLHCLIQHNLQLQHDWSSADRSGTHQIFQPYC